MGQGIEEGIAVQTEIMSVRQLVIDTAPSIAGMAAAVDRIDYRNTPDEYSGQIVVARMYARDIAAKTAEVLRLLGEIERGAR